METQKDPVLQRLKNVILNSWPRYKANLHPTVQVYWDYQEELIVHNELIFNSDTVVIPTVLREDMLKPFINDTLIKKPASDEPVKFCSGQKLTKKSSKCIKACCTCNQNKKRQQRETLKPHPTPSRPWQRVGVDIFTFHKRNYQVTVDFYSGWFELDLLNDTTASTVISKLKSQMARHGIPDVLMSDNGRVPSD